jgi:tetratricopeptide (TPR) repeat protein
VAREADLLVQENPSSTFAFTAAAKSYAAIGQNEKAMQVLERALAIRPDAYVYINRSQVRPKTDITGRLGDLEAALKIDPRSSDALLEKSRVLTETGDYARALAAMEQTNAADDLLIRTQRAILLSKLGRTTEAQDLAEAARASANSPEELNSICYTKATAGTMLESALQDCMAALKLTPGEASYEDSLGMVLLRLGRLDDAIAAYSSALAKRPIPESYMGRALAYARKGNRAAAQKDKAEAIKLNAGIETLFAGYGLKLDETAAAQATPAKVQPATKH